MRFLRARIPSAEQETRYGMDRIQDRGSFNPRYLEIEKGVEEGFLLISIDEKGWPFVETWHPSVEDAVAEAKSLFRVGEDDWESVTPQST